MIKATLHRTIRRYAWDIVAILMILWGIFALVTPFTPASWIMVPGLCILVGKRKTSFLLKKILGQRLFDLLRIDKLEHLATKITGG